MSATRWFRQPFLCVFCLALVSCDRASTALDPGEPALSALRDQRSDALERRQPDLSQSNAATLPTQCPEGATTWVNAVNGNWLDAARWSAGVPTATTPACIDLPGAYIVTLTAAFAATTVPAQSVFLGDPGAAVQPTLRMIRGTVIVSTDVTAHGRLELSPVPGTGGISLIVSETVGVAPTGTLTAANTGGHLFEAATIENWGTINAGTGLGLRAAAIVNRSSIVVPASRLLGIRGPSSGGAPTVTWEAGAVEVLGTFDQFDGDLIVRGGTFTGLIRLHDADELRLEHDGGGRFNILSLGGFVPPTTTLLAGVVGANQHVWMGTNHLTVRTSGLVNKGLVTLHASGALGRQGLILSTDPGATIVNEGTLVLNAASPFNLAPNLHGTITNEESGLIVNAGGTVSAIAPSPLINRGTLRAAVSQIRFVDSPDGTVPEVILEDGSVESTAGRYQQTGGSLTVRGGTVAGQLDLIAVSDLRLEHDGGGRFNLLALGGQVPATTSRLSGTIGPSQHVWMGNNHITVETGGLVNQGQLTVSHVGASQKTATTLQAGPGTTLLNEGTLTLQSSPNSGPVLAGAITNAAGALLTSVGGHAVVNPAPLVNRGTLRSVGGTLFVRADGPPPEVEMDGGTLQLTNAYSQTGGEFRYRGGTVSGTGGSTFSGVRFSGFGTWGRTLTLTGASALAPGASPGRLAISGDYTPSITTVTEIELAGSEPGTGYDQIAVANTARFAGSLSVSLANGFMPRACQTFEIVTYAARTVTFTNATAPIDIGGGMKLRQVYTPTALVLVAYNANGPNVSPTQVSVSVDGTTDTYDVCIGAGSDVITVSPDNQVTVDKQTLTFGASQLPQTVTVSASPSATQSTALITHTAASGTPVGSVTVLISGIAPSDTDPPTTTAAATPGPNEHGWNRTNVAVALTASDEKSGVAEIVWQLTGAQIGSATVPSSATSVTVTAEGTTRLTYFARDVAGNQEAPKTLDIRIDKTAPSVTATRSPLANANGWNNSDVTATFTGTDALSGIDGSETLQVVFTDEGANQSATRTFRDRAGNETSAIIDGISIDKTPPAVSCSATPNVIWPPNRQLVPVSIAVLVEDALAGAGGFLLNGTTSNEPEPNDIVDFVLGTADTDGRVRAWRLGNGTGRVYTFEYRGFDRAGNSSIGVCEVRVPHDQRGGGQ